MENSPTWCEDGPGPSVTVDVLGMILSIDGPHSALLVSGQPLSAAFETESAARLERCRGLGWWGVGEWPFQMRDGRMVRVVVAPDVRGGAVVSMLDITAHTLLCAARIQRARREAISHHASEVSRELIDPMSIVQGRLELLLDLGVSDADTAFRHLTIALQHARRVGEVLGNLRRVARRSTLELDAVPIGEVINEALSLSGGRCDRVVVELTPKNLVVGAQRDRVARVLMSLLWSSLEDNRRGVVLVQAARRRRDVQISIGPRGRPPGDPVSVDPEWTNQRALLSSVGGDLAVFRRHNDRHFELTLPAAPATRQRARPADAEFLLLGPVPFCSAVERLLCKDGFQFRVLQGSDEVQGMPDAVAVSLEQARGPSGLATASRIVQTHPDLAGKVMVVGSFAEAHHGPVVRLPEPLRRADVLEALGRRVRRC